MKSPDFRPSSKELLGSLNFNFFSEDYFKENFKAYGADMVAPVDASLDFFPKEGLPRLIHSLPDQRDFATEAM